MYLSSIFKYFIRNLSYNIIATVLQKKKKHKNETIKIYTISKKKTFYYLINSNKT